MTVDAKVQSGNMIVRDALAPVKRFEAWRRRFASDDDFL
jgi:hypothetical protein